MEVLSDGTFTFNFETGDLMRGLRSSKRAPRNEKFLVQCVGAVGIDQVLSVIDDLESDRIDTESLGASWPFPQIFVLKYMTLVCTDARIYEYTGGGLTLRHGPVSTDGLWSCVDYFDYLYMSNGAVAVRRKATSGNWSTVSSLPYAKSMVDYNGQIMLGSPER